MCPDQEMKSEFSIVIAGDLLPSSGNVSRFIQGDCENLYDEGVRELFESADFSIVNLEGPLTNAVIKQDKVGPVLKAPIEAINGLKCLGVSCVALANNHFTDYLLPGCTDTLSSLDSAGIKHIGGGINLDSINSNIEIVLGNKKVCIYNVSELFFNLPSETSAGVNVYDEYLVCNEIKELKRTNDFLIVIYHGGAEMCQYPTPTVRKRFHRMADSGADFITAQHTHCIGCEEYYHDSYLLYGQGNFFLDHMRDPLARQGLISQICYSEGSFHIKHHIVNTENGRVVLNDEQDFNAFQVRSREIQSEALSEKRYVEFIRNNTDLKRKYYQSFKGNFWGKRVLGRISPRWLLRHIEHSYSKAQLERIVFSLESDRMREDVLCLWKQLKKSKL